MKNAVFLFALIPLTFSNLLGQESEKKSEQVMQTDSPQGSNIKAVPPKINKSEGDTLWYEDFSNGFVSNQWNTSGPTPWVYTTQAPGGPGSIIVGPLQSTTGTNGFASMQSEFYNTPRPPSGIVSISEYLTSGPISISPRAAVSLRWQQGYRFCCSLITEKLEVQVSNDNVNWIAFDAKKGSPVNTTVLIENIEFDISAVAGNQSTIYIRFYNKSSFHYWMIDDIAIVEGIRNELNVTDNYLHAGKNVGSGYSMLPCNSGYSLIPAGKVKNTGGLAASNVRLKSSMSMGGSVWYDGISDTVAILNPSADSLLTMNSRLYLPNVAGNYSVSFVAESDSINYNVKSSTYEIEVTDSTYARDLGVVGSEVGPVSITNGSPNGYMIGLVYELKQPQKMSSASFYVSANPKNAGTEIRVNVYSVYPSAANMGSFVGAKVAQSTSNYTLQPTDLDQWISLSLNSTLGILQAGHYLVALEQVSGAQNVNELLLGKDVLAEKNQSFGNEVFCVFYAYGMWIDALAVPMIRLNVSDTLRGGCTPVGLTNRLSEISDFIIQPNPTNGQFSIVFPDYSNVLSIDIYGINGREVEQRSISNVNSTISFDLRDQPKGLYLIRINLDRGVVTKKVLLQ